MVLSHTERAWGVFSSWLLFFFVTYQQLLRPNCKDTDSFALCFLFTPCLSLSFFDLLSLLCGHIFKLFFQGESKGVTLLGVYTPENLFASFHT